MKTNIFFLSSEHNINYNNNNNNNNNNNECDSLHVDRLKDSVRLVSLKTVDSNAFPLFRFSC